MYIMHHAAFSVLIFKSRENDSETYDAIFLLSYHVILKLKTKATPTLATFQRKTNFMKAWFLYQVVNQNTMYARTVKQEIRLIQCICYIDFKPKINLTLSFFGAVIQACAGVSDDYE